MNIVFLHHSFIIGNGTDSLIYQYSKRLQAMGHKVTIATFRTNYLPNTSNLNIKVIDFPQSETQIGSAVLSPLLLTGKYNHLKDIINPCDIVITMMYPSTRIFEYLKNRYNFKAKWVHIEWSTPRFKWHSIKENIYYRIFSDSNRSACKKADLVLVASRFLKSYVKEFYGVESKFMFLDGIDFTLLDKSKFPPYLEDSKDILFIGRITPHKNIELLIKAFRVSEQEFPSSKLILVGSMPNSKYIESLRSLIKDICPTITDKIQFKGPVFWSELPNYYYNCAFQINPSLWEGFMRCECYAFEKPLIVLDNTSNRETAWGRGIILKDESTPNDLAWSINHLLSNKDARHQMGLAGYTWAKENLDLDKIIKNLEGELNAIITRGN